MRIFFGFLFAPLFPGLLLLIMSAVRGNFEEGIWLFGFSCLIAYPLSLVFGTPIYIFLRKRSLNGLASYFGIGALLSVFPAIYFIVLPMINDTTLVVDNFSFVLSKLMLFTTIFLASVSATCMFWFIVRPDLKRNSQV